MLQRSRTAALVLLSIFCLIVVAGCRQKDSYQLPIKTQQIKPGGQLSYGSLQEPNTLNPLFSDLLATAEISSLIYNGLVAMNEKGEWVPDLALEVPSLKNGGLSKDGRVVTYKLKQGVTWHDGQPFTADDVVFTWQIIMNSRNPVISREGYAKIASINTPDQYTVVINFNDYYAPFMGLFSTILPKHVLENEPNLDKAAFNYAPIGTGPFKFKEWRVAKEIVLEANPDYFEGKPYLDGIIYKVMPDITALLAQLEEGALDVAGHLPFAQLEQIKNINSVKPVITPNMMWEHLDFNLDHEIFREKKVRQAIALAIDRKEIVNTNLKNDASPAAGDQSPLSWAYNPTLEPLKRNVAMARDLLNQAGFKQGADGIFVKDGCKLSFTLTTTAGNTVREHVTETIVQQLREAGIEMKAKYVGNAEFFNEILKKRRFEAALFATTGSGDPDNTSLWNSQKIPGDNNGYEGQNYAGWRNRQIDLLTEQAVHSSDIEVRKQAYFTIEEILKEECPVIPLYFYANIDAVKKTVVNYTPNPTPIGRFWHAWQWGFAQQ